MADLHLQAYADDDLRVTQAWREQPKPALSEESSDLLQSHLDRAVKGGADLILMAGDLFHFPTQENRDLALTAFESCPIPVKTVPGNHDWFFPGQDGWEDLRERQLPELKGVFGANPSYWVDEVNGLRILGLDNSTYFLTRAQCEFLREQCAQPDPLLVMMHIPLSLPGLREKVIAKHGNPILMHDP